MSFSILLPFLLLGFAFISLWVRKDPKIWGTLLGCALLASLIQKTTEWTALFVVIGWVALWVLYVKKQKTIVGFVVFLALIVFSFGFKFHIYPGFNPIHLASRFYLRLDSPIVGLLPLALLIPLAKTDREWKEAIFKGLWLICLGIGILALMAVLSGAIRWEMKIPSFPALRYSSNLILVAIPEEGFYRGFIQKKLCDYLQNSKKGNAFALAISSAISTLAHAYWSPSWAILGFVFLASLLYGGVYLLTKRIESSILCHFLLNAIHMTFFQYHAM